MQKIKNDKDFVSRGIQLTGGRDEKIPKFFKISPRSLLSPIFPCLTLFFFALARPVFNNLVHLIDNTI